MKKGIILYKSKYGSTKKYANWLSVKTGYDLYELSKPAIKKITGYKNIVMCGGVYASGISGISFIKKRFKYFKNKNIAVFCVGASPLDESALSALKSHNLKEELSAVPLFYGRGAWNESKMSFVDRTLCRMLIKFVSKKDPETYEPWQSALMEAVRKECDWTDERYLDPLIELINEW